MTSISDLPDDSLYMAAPDQVREFVSGVCIADSVVEVIIGSGTATCRAALLTLDFSTDPAALEALQRLPEPSLSGTVRWSWLHGRGTDAEDEGDGTLWRFDVTTETDDPVSFAVAGGITPEIRALLEEVDRILITAEEPIDGLGVLDTVLAEIPGGFNDSLS